jgi:hypothetical protein
MAWDARRPGHFDARGPYLLLPSSRRPDVSMSV